MDTCYSGAAVGFKANNTISTVSQYDVPKGVAIIASSRATELSRELPDGSASLFTDLLCKGIETGLEGHCTDDGLITVNDIISYIHEKLNSDQKDVNSQQHPVFNIHEAEEKIWIARNLSGNTSQEHEHLKPSHYVRSLEELEFLYKNTVHTLHPCTNTTALINWFLGVSKLALTASEALSEPGKYPPGLCLGSLDASPGNARQSQL